MIFTEPIFVPSNLTVLKDRVISVRIKPGNAQDLDAIKIDSWNITSMTKSKLIF